MKNNHKVNKVLSIVTISALLSFSIPLNFAFSASATEKKGTITNIKSVNANQEAVEEIAQAAQQGLDYVSVHKLRLVPEDMKPIFDALHYCHPELFYMGLSMRFSYDGTYVCDVELNYSMPKEEIPQATEAFNAEVEELMSKIDDSMTDLEKALILHDEIIVRATYNLKKLTAYDLLINGCGRCTAYSNTYAYLLSLAGIDSEIVESETMNHEWNKVCIDGVYYNVDVTYDDPYVSATLGDDGEYTFIDTPGHADHNYFMRSDYDFQYDESLLERHVNYTYINESPGTYDERAFRKIDTKLCYENGYFYYIDNSTTEEELFRYDMATDKATRVKKFNFVWKATPTKSFINGFMGIDSLAGVLYYCSASEVYALDLETGFETTFSNDEAISGKCYGVRIINGEVYAVKKTSLYREAELVNLGKVIKEPPKPTEPPTTVAPTTIAPTTVAPTTIPPTTIPPTTIPPTTIPPTTIPPTTVPPTTIPPTTIPPTTIAPTTIAPTTVAPTTIAPTTVAPTTITPTTISPTTEPLTTEPEEQRLLGDIDGDGRLSINDATMIQFILANLMEFDERLMPIADLDGDGRLSINDATIMQFRIAELIKKFPVEEN